VLYPHAVVGLHGGNLASEQEGTYRDWSTLGPDSILINVGAFSRPIKPDETLEDWYVTYAERTREEKVDESAIVWEPTEIANREAMRITLSAPDSIIIIFRNDQRVYFIQKWPAMTDFDDDFQRILDSFTFLDDASKDGM